ncbi:YdbH domain-containing protein [Motiliproteus sp. MSK22-1]|uniref:YdbH domain-containing protein n=1 Tax=Motiliproteus sp. MSK22-1 TaxID=1897630 RepID=UPI000976AAA0|nr:YdbH domain-containing protein [Motiliproteus sp. MSK22-1]OMH38178.1 hypothetical protein BGP75_07930 [Motiliproteus sp. MSK22-1]
MKLRIVVVIILTLVVCYLAAPKVLSWKARTMLQQLGCQQSQALFESPRWNSLIIRKLSLRDCPELSINQLSVSKVFLGFSPKRLLLEQQLDLLELKALQADISLSPSEEDSSPDSTPSMLAASLPAMALEELFRQLPVDQIAVEVKQLKATVSEHQIEFTGHLDATPQRLKSKAVLELDHYPALAIEVEANQQNQIHLALSDRTTEIYNLDAALSIEEADKKGRFTTNLTADIKDKLNLSAALSYLNQASLTPAILRSDPQEFAPPPPNSASTASSIPDKSQSSAVKLLGESRNHWQISIALSDDLNVGWKAFNVTQQLEAELDLSLNNQEIQKVSGSLKALLNWQPDKIDWKLLEGTQLDISITPGLLPHPALANQWQLMPENDLSGKLTFDPEISLRSSNGKLLVQSTGKQELKTETYFSHFRWQPKSAYAHYDTKLDRQLLLTGSVASRQLEAHGQGTLAIADSLISMNLDAGSYLTTEELQISSSSSGTISRKKISSSEKQVAPPVSVIEQLKLVTNTPLQLRTNFGQTSWLLSPIKLNFASGGIALNSDTESPISSEAMSGQLSMKLPQNSTELSGQLDLDLHHLSLENWNTPQIEISLPYRLRYPSLRFNLTGSFPGNSSQSVENLDPGKNLRFTGKGQVDLDNLALKSEWLLPPVDIAQVMTLLPSAIISQMPEWTTEGGQISGVAKLNSNRVKKTLHWQSDADIGITGLNLRIPNWYISNARGAFQLSAGSKTELSGNGVIGVDRIEGALSIDNITSAFSLPPSPDKTIQIHQARMNLFDGSIYTDAFSLPLAEKAIQSGSTGNNLKGRPQASTTLHLSGLDLSQILALQPKADISGSGRLNGALPLSLTPKGLSINDGHIEAQSPGGMLAYRPAGADALASGNYGLKIAMKVLEAFHYQTLGLTVNYQPDGTLILDTALKGHNPGWQNGQPIDFNIRIEQNLLKLLKAIQFSSNLSEDLEKRIQQGME